YREPGQLLERLEDLASRPDQLLQGRADHGHHGPVFLDVHVDVPVQVGDIEEPLDVVSGDLALELQGGEVRRSGLLVAGTLIRSLRDVAQADLRVGVAVAASTSHRAISEPGA